MCIDFIPILVVPAVPHDGGIRFLHRDNQIDIGPNIAGDVWKILELCSGRNNVASIIEASNLPKDYVFGILSELEGLELIVDSRYQFMHFHRISNYPTGINSGLTQEEVEKYTASKRLPTKTGQILDFEKDEESSLFPIRKKRRSCRNFSKRKMTRKQIGNICHYAYSIPDHSVPSGGALYPLKIYVLVEYAQENLAPGYYEYDAEKNVLILFNDKVDIEQLKYCFNQEEMPFGSSVQVVIAADMSRQPYKYANRGYRLTLIEVGHAAENISLYSAEQGLGACEMGGVQDKPLKQELNLDGEIWPIVSISIGYPAEPKTECLNKVRFVEERVGEKFPVKGVWSSVFGRDGSFFGATAMYTDNAGSIQYAGATSPSYADAIFKAMIEGYERFLSGQVRVDFYGTARKITGDWLDPRLYFPLTKEQAYKCNVREFSDDLDINWTMGINWDGSSVLVPSDLIYYGQNNDENRIYFGNSSGIAAHFDFDEAKKRAVVELIERDALMRNWFAQQSPPILASSLLPPHIINRISHWGKQGRRMVVLQIPSDYGMVFETIIIGDEYPCFVSGAAATIDNSSIPNAILKSAQEAEYNLLLAIRYPNMAPINPEEVLTPMDHGRLYYARENAERIRWLYNGSVQDCYANVTGSSDVAQFYADELKLVTVDLSDASSDLRVVRVFSPKLVPINFGYYTAHYTHPVLRNTTQISHSSLSMPHYFA